MKDTYEKQTELNVKPITNVPNIENTDSIPRGLPMYEGHTCSSSSYFLLIRSILPLSMNRLMKYENADVRDEFLGITNPI